MKTDQLIFAMGNEAITAGAIAAGARFYAGYPITPSSEIAETSAARLPEVGGMYIQMEDEIASIAAIIGASAAGVKAYTATSGPGFSLMQENLGVAVMGEVPIVIVDVMRSGPSTGLATKPAQGDVMQARWGTHGDHGIIALSPASVQECYDLTIEAFNLAERFRTPVILLADEIVGHLREGYTPWQPSAAQLVERTKPEGPPQQYRLYDFAGAPKGIAPMATYGSPYIYRINGSGHDESGAPSGVPANAERFIRHYTEKIEQNAAEIVHTKRYMLDDAEYAIVAYGCSVRSAKAALRLARQKGIRLGLLQLQTVWPFASEEVAALTEKMKAILVPELNLGQILGEVLKVRKRQIPILGIPRVDSLIITPQQILEALEEVA